MDREKAWNQAEQEIPTKWYENQKTIGRLAGLFASVSWLAWLGMGDNLPLHIASAAIYIAGTTADNYSTQKFFRFADRASAQGVEIESEEKNESLYYLNKVQNKEEEYLKDRTLLKWDGVVTAVSTLFPPFGLAFGTERLIASRNNSRRLRREERAAELQLGQV